MASDADETKKKRRMGNEVVFACDSTLSIPAAGTLFRITKVENEKRKTLTVDVFAENLETCTVAYFIKYFMTFSTCSIHFSVEFYIFVILFYSPNTVSYDMFYLY